MSGWVRSTRMSKWLMGTTLPGLRTLMCRFLPAYKYTSGSAPQRAPQGLVQIRVRVGEAERERALRHGALARHHDVGHLAVEHAHREARDRRNRWAAQRTTERAAERLVGGRLGSGRVDGPAPVRAVERGEVERDEVVEVDPRQELAAAGYGSAGPGPKERQHPGERAAALVEHDAGAHAHDAHAELLGRGRLALPGDADAGEEVVARRRRLAHRLPAMGPVVADRRRRHEHAGPRVRGAQPGDEVAAP